MYGQRMVCLVVELSTVALSQVGVRTLHLQGNEIQMNGIDMMDPEIALATQKGLQKRCPSQLLLPGSGNGLLQKQEYGEKIGGRERGVPTTREQEMGMMQVLAKCTRAL
jgi:hypothetical protein